MRTHRRSLAISATFVLVSFLPRYGPLAMVETPPDPYVVGVSIVVAQNKSCPIFIGSVTPKSPAALAQIVPGDRLLAIDGTDVRGKDVAQAAKMIRAEVPGNVALKLWRKGRTYQVVLQREKFSSILAREGMKIDHFIVPLDTTEDEISRMIELQEGKRRIVDRVFPLHYPLNTELFYGGFELFVYGGSGQVAVGGLEHGPASRAGIHQGDIIVTVNQVDPTGKNRHELEELFSSDQPKHMKLIVDRVGVTKTIEFDTHKASDILNENHRRMVNGTLIPDGVADEDVRCFVEKEKR